AAHTFATVKATLKSSASAIETPAATAEPSPARGGKIATPKITAAEATAMTAAEPAPLRCRRRPRDRCQSDARNQKIKFHRLIPPKFVLPTDGRFARPATTLSPLPVR